MIRQTEATIVGTSVREKRMEREDWEEEEWESEELGKAEEEGEAEEKGEGEWHSSWSLSIGNIYLHINE